MQSHHLRTLRTSRYYILGNQLEEVKDIWLVLHGYGQLARYFLKHFESLHHTGNIIVAPEALSRYYVNENTGRIGASWMTKDDREHEIVDYLEYLNSVMDCIPVGKSSRIHVLGFSQGAATACRYAMHAKLDITSLVCWAGFFPPDMNWNASRYLKEKFQAYLVYGNNDPYLNENLKAEVERVIENLPKKPELITFEGKHEMHASTLNDLFVKLENN